MFLLGINRFAPGGLSGKKVGIGPSNQLITLALAGKLSALGAEDYLEVRAKRASKTKFLKAMSKAAKAESQEYDRL